MTPEYPKLMACYNRWMNERLYQVCSELSDEERKQDRGAFFRSVHGTLNHLLLADRVWLGRFTESPCPVAGLDQELYSDFAELWAERRSTDSTIEQWSTTLTEPGLQSTLSYTSLVNPEPRAHPYWIAVTHFFNHQTHHRGQLTTLLGQMGKEYGVTDLVGMPGSVLIRPGSDRSS